MGGLEAGPDKALEVSCNKTMSMVLISRRLSESSIKNEPATQPISNPMRNLFSLGCVQKARRKVPLEIGLPRILVVEPTNLCHHYWGQPPLFGHRRTKDSSNVPHRHPSTRNDQIFEELTPRSDDWTEDGSTLLGVCGGSEVI